MRFTHHAPGARLRTFIKTIWRATGTRAEFSAPEPIVPDGCVEIVFNLADPFTGEDGVVQPRVLLAGQMTRPVVALPTGHVDLLGVRFFTGRAGSVLRAPMWHLQDRLVDAAAVVPAVDRLGDALANLPEEARLAHLDRVFVARGGNRPLHDIDRAIGLIERTRGTIAIEPLARHVGISRRHLERRFNEEVGLGAKQLSRILRLQAALALLRREPHSTGALVAAQCGYTDQAHLIRECRSLAGHLPTRLAATAESLGPLLRSHT